MPDHGVVAGLDDGRELGIVGGASVTCDCIRLDDTQTSARSDCVFDCWIVPAVAALDTADRSF